MRELPILCNTEVVKAILKDQKTVTRRQNSLAPVNLDPDLYFLKGLVSGAIRNTFAHFVFKENPDKIVEHILCPFGKIGDLLYVREAFAEDGFEGNYVFKSDFGDLYKWRPAIHMPKEAARIWLKVSNISVERLQDITTEDAILEGIETFGDEPLKFYKNYGSGKDFLYDSKYGFNFGKETHTAQVASFCTLWMSIYGRESWILNPWVWRIKFEKIEK